MRANRAPIRTYMAGSVMGIPSGLAARLAPPFVNRGVRVNEGTDEAVRSNLAALDSLLSRVDERIAGGVLDGERRQVAA